MYNDKAPDTVEEFAGASKSLRAALNLFKLSLSRSLNICFPACILSYKRETHKATVMPLIKEGFFTGKFEYIRRRPIEVTVRAIQCGGITIDFPLFVGDTGWVISSDRDTKLIKEEGKPTTNVLVANSKLSDVEDNYQAEPAQPQLHEFSQGFFIPDSWGLWESNRYKDYPTSPLNGGLYIGSSFDSFDKDKATSGAYEGRETSSLFLAPQGGVILANSRPKEENASAHMRAANGQIELLSAKQVEAQDANNRSSINLDAENGLLIRNISKTGETMIVAKAGELSAIIEDTSGEKPSRICIQVAEGSVNIITDKDVNVNARDVSVAAGGNADIVATGDININSAQSTNIAVGEDAYIATARDASVFAGNSIEIKSGANTKIKAIGEIELTSKQKDIKLNVDKGNVAIKCNQKIDISSNSNIDLRGETINIVASKEIILDAPSVQGT